MISKTLNICDITPSCQYGRDCGGCDYIGMSYAASLQTKLDEFKKTMMCLPGIEETLNGLTITASKNPTYWRTRCQLQIKKGTLGFFKKKSHDLIEIEECIMLDKRLNTKIKELNFPDTVDGKIELYIKNGKVCERFVEQKFQNLFLQVNEAVNEELVDTVLNYLDPVKQDNILELFCGLGNFTLPIAKKSTVTGIDLQVPPKGKETNPEFIEMDAMKGVMVLKEKNRLVTFNKLLLDPPRAGAGKKMLAEIIENKKIEKIVYVSCNTETFVNDAAFLINNSYRLEKISAMDMFPFSKYIESVSLFSL